MYVVKVVLVPRVAEDVLTRAVARMLSIRAYTRV